MNEEKRIKSNKVTEKMKQIINGDFLRKNEQEMEKKLELWKEEILKENENLDKYSESLKKDLDKNVENIQVKENDFQHNKKTKEYKNIEITSRINTYIIICFFFMTTFLLILSFIYKKEIIDYLGLKENNIEKIEKEKITKKIIEIDNIKFQFEKIEKDGKKVYRFEKIYFKDLEKVNNFFKLKVENINKEKNKFKDKIKEKVLENFNK